MCIFSNIHDIPSNLPVFHYHEAEPEGLAKHSPRIHPSYIDNTFGHIYFPYRLSFLNCPLTVSALWNMYADYFSFSIPSY